MRKTCTLPLFLLASSCGSAEAPAAGVAVAPPAGWDAEVALPEAVDRDPDPAVIAVDLDAAVAQVSFVPGVSTSVWAYGGAVPGPLLRGKVGDRLVVHFTNHLPEETTIHWHGLRVPAAMDGTPMVQAPVPPGGSFTYDFVLRDAGAYWYHPHVRSNAQVGRGLYGMIVVDPADDAPEPPLGLEVPLVLDDVALEADGSLAPQDQGGNLGDFFGREGNTLLVNGRQRPTILATPGAPLRLRIVNAANARYFQLGLAGHAFTRVGGDGGLLEAPIASPAVIVPGERADLVLVPRGPSGDVLTVQWLPYDRGYCSDCRPPEPLFDIALSGPPAGAVPAIPPHLRAIERIDTAGAVERTITLTEGSVSGMAVLGIEGYAGHHGAPLAATVGETHVWSIVNATNAHHPFHLHGFFFQPLSKDGGEDGGESVPWAFTEQKDTLDIPSQRTVRVAVRFDERPGSWMFHCHILDHAELGMMGMLELAP